MEKRLVRIWAWLLILATEIYLFVLCPIVSAALPILAAALCVGNIVNEIRLLVLMINEERKYRKKTDFVVGYDGSNRY